MEECVTDPQAIQYVRCLKCNKIIKCSRHDTTQLIEHIKCDHPEVKVVESGGPRNDKLNAAYSSDNHSGGNEKAKGNDSSGKSRSEKGHLFRTSIERWRPANGTIFCPFCSCKKQPLVKMRNERFSGNSCAANCMLACWPLCFLPFLIPGNNKEYLYCANCRCFLGLYDKDNNCVRPNKQFSEKLKNVNTEAH